MIDKTLYEIVRERDNDYSVLEDMYRLATGGELACDPFNSVWRGPERITLSASIVIPAWNAGSTIQQCLISIEQSSFNRRYPYLLEVIVVDDGSTDSTWDVLEHLRLNLRLTAVQQAHHSRSQAMNTGISIAQGDVIISCDADMILTSFSIEELVKRHQVLDRVLLIGFRCDVNADDSRIHTSALPERLPAILPKFYGDNRLVYHWDGRPYPGWPENMCRESSHLKDLGCGKRLWMPDGNTWNLPRMVYGALFSMRRNDWQVVQGFDERFYGWGWEDTLVGARALALGNFIIPVYAATGLHIAHPVRSPRQWKEAAANSQLCQRILRSPFTFDSGRVLKQARERIVRQIHFPPTSSMESVARSWYEVFKAELTSSDRLGKYLYHLGHYDDAVAAFSVVKGSELDRAWALYNQGRALRGARRHTEAVAVLTEATNRLLTHALPLVELALAQAANGDFNAARVSLEQVGQREPKNRLLSYVLRTPAYKHLRRGRKYVAQNYHLLAVRDFEAALIQDPDNAVASHAREVSLRELEEMRKDATEAKR